MTSVPGSKVMAAGFQKIQEGSAVVGPENMLPAAVAAAGPAVSRVSQKGMEHRAYRRGRATTDDRSRLLQLRWFEIQQ
jgi:hypothetical protein